MKIASPRIVHITGEEMSRHTMDLVIKQWIAPHLDISNWRTFDLSAKNRDTTQDQVLKDAIKAGAEVKSILKEPTVTPTAAQAKEMGLSKAWGSPNGAMRKGWNGFTISRDTIHIDGLELGYKKPVLFDRHAVGGEYSASWKEAGPGKVVTTFYPAGGSEPVTICERVMKDKNNVVVTYDNPLDNVPDLARHFFSRSLAAEVKPYVVTKKTVFKWQEPFWQIMEDVFNKEYKEKFAAAGIFKKDEKLGHLISDDAAMKLVRWTDGCFAMVSHNYDGDMLTDEMSQIHKSPGFITSVLVGRTADGTPVKQFEASHGTGADQYQDMKAGKDTSFNPLGLAEALMGALDHGAALEGPAREKEIKAFTSALRAAIHKTMVSGRGTRDLSGPKGLTTGQFIGAVAEELKEKILKAA